MKRRIGSGSQPLAQICRRLSEVTGSALCEKACRKNNKVSVINKMNIIIGDMKNSCILFNDDSVGIIIKQAQDTLYVKKFVRKFPLFEKPIDTTFLNLYKVSGKTKTVIIGKDCVKAKCFICPFKGDYAIIPIL